MSALYQKQLKFYPDNGYTPDFDKYLNDDSIWKSVRVWDNPKNKKLSYEISYTNDENLAIDVELLESRGLVKSTSEVDVRFIKRGVKTETILEHGIFDRESKKTIWQNPLIKPISRV